MKYLTKQPIFAATAMAVALLTACATTPPQNAMLSDAHVAYDQALADPETTRSAPDEMQKARIALQNGDTVLGKEGSVTDVDHYAYIARQRVASAMQAAATARSEQAASRANAQRDQIVLAARTREAETQRANAAVANADAAAARQQADAARAQLAALQAQQTDRGMVLTMGDVLFDTGKATLKDGAMSTIDRLADFMNKYPAERVRIEGYTDSTGGDSMNVELSRRRANAVRDALLDRRVDSSRIDVAALGERYPVASNDTSAGRQRNRRIEVVFSDQSGAFNATRS